MATTVDLKDILECPVCLQVPRSSPIYECESGGHRVCNQCHPKLTSCPVCRGPMGKRRSLVSEKVLEKIPLPCKFAGCTIEAIQDVLLQHQEECAYRLVHCVDLTCDTMVPFIHIMDHMRAQHMKTRCCTKFLSPGSVCFPRYLQFEGRDFFSEFWIKNNIIISDVWVYLVGTSTEAKEYSYELKLLEELWGETTLIKGEVVSIDILKEGSVVFRRSNLKLWPCFGSGTKRIQYKFELKCSKTGKAKTFLLNESCQFVKNEQEEEEKENKDEDEETEDEDEETEDEDEETEDEDEETEDRDEETEDVDEEMFESAQDPDIGQREASSGGRPAMENGRELDNRHQEDQVVEDRAPIDPAILGSGARSVASGSDGDPIAAAMANVANSTTPIGPGGPPNPVGVPAGIQREIPEASQMEVGTEDPVELANHEQDNPHQEDQQIRTRQFCQRQGIAVEHEKVYFTCNFAGCRFKDYSKSKIMTHKKRIHYRPPLTDDERQ